MRRWTKQIRALELFGEKNRLGRGSNSVVSHIAHKRLWFNSPHKVNNLCFKKVPQFLGQL